MPLATTIERVVRLTEKERLLRVSSGQARFSFEPGQFFMAGLPGYGEAPFSISSFPFYADGGFELCIRAVGNLSSAIHRLRKGDTLWVRGPFGRGFDLQEFKGKDIVFVAGGIGIVPMRSLVKAVAGQRDEYGRLTLIYGSKTPDDILFNEELRGWSEAGFDVRLTIDAPHPAWKGNVGVVTTIIPHVEMDPSKTVAVIIGPPVMYRFVILSLWDKRLPREKILVSLERRMKCGVGKCGHCQINNVYTCQEGPVFRLSEIRNLPEAL